MRCVPTVVLILLCRAGASAQSSDVFILQIPPDRQIAPPSAEVWIAGDAVELEGHPDSKNPGLAALYSLIVPGMGELYAGQYGIGRYFTIAEVVLWIGFGSLDAYGNWLRDDARRFAALHAGIEPGGKDDQYFVDIGNYGTIDDYNNQKLLERSVTRLYDPALGYAWRWDADANRASYRDLRISHDRILNSTRFVVAAVIVNHIASAVNAARLAIARNNSLEQASLIDVRAHVTSHASLADGIMISVSATF